MDFERGLGALCMGKGGLFPIDRQSLACRVLDHPALKTRQSDDNDKENPTIFKKGWIYTKGNGWFSKWKTKWGVLSQILPLTWESGAIQNGQEDCRVYSARLDLYDEKSHFELGIRPKYSIALQKVFLSDLASDADQTRGNFSWMIHDASRDYILSTFSMEEKDEWCSLLNRLRDPLWFQPIVEGKVSPKDSNGNHDEQGLMISPISEQTPGEEIAYENACIFDEETIHRILRGHYDMVKLQPEVVSKMAEQDWNEFFQQYNPGFPQYSLFLGKNIEFVKRLSVFKECAVRCAKELVDQLYKGSANGVLAKESFIGNVMTRLITDKEEEKYLELEVKACQSIQRTKIANGIRNRLFWIVDYKGFRVKVDVIVRDTRTMLNLASDGVERSTLFVHYPSLEKECVLGRELNLKGYKLRLDNFDGEIDVGISKYFGIQRDGRGRMYSVNASSLLPLDIGDNGEVDYDRRLRMEWVNMVEERGQVNADAFKNHEFDDAMDKEVLSRISRRLRHAHIPLVARKLDELHVVVWNGRLLSEFLHIHGVNVRYLGLVALHSSLPHVREQCVNEMIARAFKEVVRDRLKMVVSHYQEVGATKIKDGIEPLIYELYLLVFANDSESRQFVEQVLYPKIREKYGDHLAVSVKNQHQEALFNAMNEQCGVIWKETDENMQFSERLSYMEIAGFQALERGTVQEPEFYGYFRLNEYQGLGGMGLLRGQENGLANDLLFKLDDVEKDGASSPTMNYFNIVGTKNGGPQESLDHYTPPPLPCMTALYFFGQGSGKGLPNAVSACWMYLLSIHTLFVLKNPVSALLQAKVAHRLNGQWTEFEGRYLVGGRDKVLDSQIRLLKLQCELLIQDASSFDKHHEGWNKVIEEAANLGSRELNMSLGPNHPMLMRYYQNLGGSCWAGGDPEKSIRFQKLAVELAFKSLGRHHLWSQRALLLLGAYYLRSGKLADALQAFKDILQTAKQGEWKQETEKMQLFVSDVHFALGESYKLYGDLDQALEHSILAQRIKESIHGSNHFDSVPCYYQVAEISMRYFHMQDRRTNLGIREGEPIHRIMIRSMKNHAQLALECYEKLFNLFRYRMNGPESEFEAVFHSGSIYSCGPTDARNQIPARLTELTRQIMWLKVSLLEPGHREMIYLLDKERERCPNILEKLIQYGASVYFDNLVEKIHTGFQRGEQDQVSECEFRGILSLIDGNDKID